MVSHFSSSSTKLKITFETYNSEYLRPYTELEPTSTHMGLDMKHDQENNFFAH